MCFHCHQLNTCQQLPDIKAAGARLRRPYLVVPDDVFRIQLDPPTRSNLLHQRCACVHLRLRPNIRRNTLVLNANRVKIRIHSWFQQIPRRLDHDTCVVSRIAFAHVLMNNAFFRDPVMR